MTLILRKDWCSRLNSLSDAARLLSVGHRLDIATVVQFCEVVHLGGQFGVHFRVSLLTFTVGFQTHSFFQVMYSFSYDSSSAVMSSSSSMIVTFLLVVITSTGDSFSTLPCAACCGRHLPRHHVCRTTFLLSRFSAPSLCTTSPDGAFVGPPTTFRRIGPSVPWVSLPGPTGVKNHRE